MKRQISKTNESNNQDPNRDSNKKKWWRDPSTITNILLALFTLCLVGVGVLQWLTLDKTDETSWITNRAYVFLQDISIVGDGQKWNLIPQWVNGGNISTKDMKMRINLVGLGEAPGVKPGFSRCDALSEPVVPIVLGPKQVSSVTFLSLPSETFLGFQRGTIKKLYLWGRATYYDSFTSKPRITRFCFDAISILGNPTDPSATIRMLHTLCTESNCTDEDCDKDARLPPPSLPITELSAG